MTSALKAIVSLVAASVIWGLSSIYYGQLTHVPPLEVLCHRTLWSAVLFCTVIAMQGRAGELRQAMTNRKQAPMIFGAAIMIALNWFGFIFSISNGHAVEASLGYYIFPMVAVLLGRVLLAERLTAGQMRAIAVAVVGVVVLAIGLGVAPWIALWLAGTFGGYGVLKRKLGLGPVLSVTAEVAFLAPLAAMWLLARGHWDHDAGTWALLVFSGPLTAIPLILFSSAARQVRLSTVGLVQYVNPTIQFFVATLFFREPFSRWHAVAFVLIWVAVALYSRDSIRQDRAARKRASSAGTSGTTVT